MDYNLFKEDFVSTMGSAESRISHCPFKTCMVLTEIDGIAVERFTVMPSIDCHGNFGAKLIYVSDLTGKYMETFVLNNYSFDYSGSTIVRCSYMCKLVLDLAKMNPKSVGFVGNGRVCLAIRKLLSPEVVVIHGARGREGKNKEKFDPCIVDSDFSELNKCDVVFVCTNSYEKSELITGDQLKAKFIVVLDCGYTLNEDFRKNYSLYSDYPEQLRNQYDEEFPFDTKKDYVYRSILDMKDADENVCVYLHGCGINDLSMAKGLHPEYVRD